MTTKLTLNRSPYFDDYSEKSKYYQILFRPGRAVQARELTQLQTVLQKQIERLGTHLFQQGAKVLPGGDDDVRYNSAAYFIKVPADPLINTHTKDGLDTYWLNKTLKSTSGKVGITATVIGYRLPDNVDSTTSSSLVGETRLFIKYVTASDSGDKEPFSEGQELAVYDSTGNAVFTTTIPVDSTDGHRPKTGTASYVEIKESVYFYNGYFVLVEAQKIFISPYVTDPSNPGFLDPDDVNAQQFWNNTPTATIGLKMTEELKTFLDDENLLDNATGSPNFSAPGADRLFIDAQLVQIPYTPDDKKLEPNFISLVNANAGEISYITRVTQYNVLEDTLARRTYDESGDYVTEPFNIQIKDFLRDDDKDINGTYDLSRFQFPTRDQALSYCKSKFSHILPKVNGETQGYAVEYPTGSGVFYPGEAFDDPTKTYSFKKLCDSYLVARIDPGKAYVKGYEIQKLARTSVDIPKSKTFKYVNNKTIPTPIGTYFTVKDLSGSPKFGEKLGISFYSIPIDATSPVQLADQYVIGHAKFLYIENTGVAGEYKLYIYDLDMLGDYSTAQVKGIYIEAGTGGTQTFANTILSEYPLDGTVTNINPVTIQKLADVVASNAVVTLRSGNSTNGLVVDMPVTGQGIPENTKISNLGTNGQTGANLRYTVTLSQAPTAAGSGVTLTFRNKDADENKLFGVGTGWKNVPGQTLAKGDFIRVGDDQKFYMLTENPASDKELTATIYNAPSVGISDFDTTSAVKPSWRPGDRIFYQFAEIKYANTGVGAVYKLPDTYIVSLRTSDSNGNIDYDNTDMSYIIPKIFRDLSGQEIVISASQLGNYHQPTIISNHYKIVKTAGDNAGKWYTIVEGSQQSSFPNDSNIVYVDRTVSGGVRFRLCSSEIDNAALFDVVVPVQTIGQGAIERTKTLRSSVTIVPGQANSDIPLTISSGTSTLPAYDVIRVNRILASKLNGVDPDLTSNPANYEDVTALYVVDDGQRDYYYQQARVYLKPGVTKLPGNIRVEFEYFEHSGAGDYFSVDSYSTVPYEDIPNFVSSDGEIYHLADCVDFRKTDVESIATVPIEGFSCDYFRYVSRRDKIILSSKTKEFKLKMGEPNDYPLSPDDDPEGMTVCELLNKPYGLAKDSCVVTMSDNRRYTMEDIGKLEKRIKNLEYYTTLSLLEKETSELTITDASGNNRFKNGFLVDNFGSFASADSGSPDFLCSIDSDQKLARPLVVPDIIQLIEDTDSDTDRINTNKHYKKTGSIYTLPYDDVVFISQPIASKITNVNPYSIFSYVGEVRLEPWTDEWRETTIIENTVVDNTEYDAARAAINSARTSYSAPFTEYLGTKYGEEKETGKMLLIRAGHEFIDKIKDPKERAKVQKAKKFKVPEGYANAGEYVPVQHKTWLAAETQRKVTTTTRSIRIGLETTIQDLGYKTSKAITSDITTAIEYIRSREVEFVGDCFMPNSKLYCFFDDIDVTEDVRPVKDGPDGWHTLTIDDTTDTKGGTATPITRIFNLTAGSDIITLDSSVLGNTVTGLSVGMFVTYNDGSDEYFNTGTNGTTATKVDATATSTFTRKVTLTQNSDVVNISGTNQSTRGLAVGMIVTGDNIPSGTVIESINSTSRITLSKEATATTAANATETLTFSLAANQLSLNNTIKKDGTSITLTFSPTIPAKYSTTRYFTVAANGTIPDDVRPGAEVVYASSGGITRKFDVKQVVRNSVGNPTVNTHTLICAEKNELGLGRVDSDFTRNRELADGSSIQVTRFTYGDELKAGGNGRVKGVFKIPNKLSKRFKTGDVTFRLSTSSTNGKGLQGTSAGTAQYVARGWLNLQKVTITQTRMFTLSSNTVSDVGDPIETSKYLTDHGEIIVRDPVSQTFLVKETGGCFLTHIDVFFRRRPHANGTEGDVAGNNEAKPELPIILELRTVANTGQPTNVLVSSKLGVITKQASEVVENIVTVVNNQTKFRVSGTAGASITTTNAGQDVVKWNSTSPVKKTSGISEIVAEQVYSDIDISENMIPTRFTFESPIYLNQNDSYCFVLISDSDAYEVWVGQRGPINAKDKNVGTDGYNYYTAAGAPNTKIGTTTQLDTEKLYVDGDFFKSKNGLGWDIDPTVSIKFNLWKAKFKTERNGIITYVNATVPPKKLTRDGIQVLAGSSLIRVTLANHGLCIGDKVQIDVGDTEDLKGFDRSVIEDAEGHTVVSTEADYFVLDMHDTTGSPPRGKCATESGRIGGTSSFIFTNQRFDEASVTANQFAPETTSVKWSIQTTASKGVHEIVDRESKKSLPVSLEPNTKIYFDFPQKIATTINEPEPAPLSTTFTELDRLAARKSMIVKAVLVSDNPNLSPVIDLSRLSVALLSTRLTNPCGVSTANKININTEFDEYKVFVDSIPQNTNDVSSREPVTDKLYFVKSDTTLPGTFKQDDQSRILVCENETTTEVLKGLLNPGDTIEFYDASAGSTERKIVSISSERQSNGKYKETITINQPFNPAFPNGGRTLHSKPEYLWIKTNDLNTAKHLSQLDVGKYLSCSIVGDEYEQNETSGRRSFTDKLILDVQYEPFGVADPDFDGQPTEAKKKCYAKIKIQHYYDKASESSGFESRALTLIQKDRFIDEIAPNGGSCDAKYVSKALALDRESTALRISFDMQRSDDSEVDLYYRVLPANSSKTIGELNWIKAPYNVEVGGVLQESTPAANATAFVNYESTNENLPTFTSVQAKVVMRGGNSANPPLIKNFKLIALDE